MVGTLLGNTALRFGEHSGIRAALGDDIEGWRLLTVQFSRDLRIAVLRADGDLKLIVDDPVATIFKSQLSSFCIQVIVARDRLAVHHEHRVGPAAAIVRPGDVGKTTLEHNLLD